MDAVHELAQVLKVSEANQSSLERTLSYHKQVALDLLNAGYRKPVVIGYMIVDRAGQMVGIAHATRDDAQLVADAWTKDAENTGVDWDYRVAEIVEPATSTADVAK